MPDGRVVTLGSNPLFNTDVAVRNGGESDGTNPFEQRIEIFTPPYLFHGPRPILTDGPAVVQRGATASFTTPNPAAIKTARLIRASAVTHVTNVEQRSVAVAITKQEGAITITVPPQPTIVPPGPYMLFVTSDDGTPSFARWVQVP